MVGILAAIGAACSWTYACFLWRAQTKNFSAIQLNSIKNLIAVIIFSPILFSVEWPSHLREISILFLSGLIGIAIGDSLYINALKRIGTRKTLSIEALSPILANILGSILINEVLPLKAWIGAVIVSFSLIGITSQKNKTKFSQINLENSHTAGIIYAFLSVLFAVFAAVLSRSVLTTSSLSAIQTTEIRLCGAVFSLLPFAKIKLNYLVNKVSAKSKLEIFFATILGTNIGILLQQTVFQTLPIGLGWTVLSISPVLSLMFCKVEGEKINSTSICLTFTTLIGVAIALL